MRRGLVSIALVLAALLAAVPAHAALQRMGPINNAPTVGGFPAWFQDKTGLTMEFCDLMNTAELNGGWCTLIPPGPVFPENFPNNFFIEHFYHDANAKMTDANTKASLIMAVEASFSNGVTPVPGQQMTFGRIRVFITNLPFSGDYKVYHPFGVWSFPGLFAKDRLFFTEDVGLGCVGTFECTLGTSIGPFLLPSPFPGGPEVPPIPDLLPGQDPYYDALVTKTAYPGTGKKYVADPARIGAVTGGSCLPDGLTCMSGILPTDPAGTLPRPLYVTSGGLRDTNIFRIEGPGGYVLETTNFGVTGRFMTGSLAGQVTVDRASFTGTTATATPTKLDVFASAFPTTQGRVPAQPAVPAVTPVLGVYQAACGGALTIDPLTGLVTAVNPPPYTAPAATETTMASAGSNYWGQSTTYVPPALDQRYVCVEDYTARNATGQVVPAFYLKKVTDDVFITLPGGQPAAYFDGPGGGNLTVKAASSDPATVLTLTGFNVDLCIPGSVGCAATVGTAPAAVVKGLLAPPAKVQVISTAGAVAELLVSTAVGATTIAGVPVAVNDDVLMNEDCSSLPAVTCATPLVISPLANDNLNGGINPVITIAQAPRIGTAVVCNAVSLPQCATAGTIVYTPNPNVNGTEGIGYTVTVTDALGAAHVSNVAYISITITPVPDQPVAVADTTGALRGVLNSVNVLANDTSPDGPLGAGATVNIVTGNAALGIIAGTPFAGGVVTFTPPLGTAAGPYTFTYNISIPPLTSNTATVTVNVSTSEVIVVAKPIYTQAKGRWTVSGTISPVEGQTLTIKYDVTTPPTYKVNGVCTPLTVSPVIGTAVADALGNWLFDQILNSTAGVLNPSNTGGNSAGFWCSSPKSLNVKSSLGGVATPNPVIQLK